MCYWRFGSREGGSGESEAKSVSQGEVCVMCEMREMDVGGVLVGGVK